MVLGLLTVHLLGVAAFGFTCFGVFGSASFAVHIWAGLISVSFVLFAHTMSYMYLVAMTSMMRKALAGENGPAALPGDPRGPELLARSRALKASAAPWALGGMFLPMVAFILGGGAHTRVFPAAVHWLTGYAVFGFLLAAFVVVGLALLRQNRLVEAFGIAAGQPGTAPADAASPELPGAAGEGAV